MNWNRLVHAKYKKLSEERKLQKTNVWQDNRALVETISGSYAPGPCVWKVENNDNDPSRLSRGQSIGVKFFDNDRVTINVLRPHIMPFVNSPPSVMTWLSIPRNMPSKALQNKTYIPYLGNSAAEDGFIDELIVSFETNGSEKKDGNHFLDNETFIELVQALIPHQRNTNVNSSSQDNEPVNVKEPSNLYIPESIIFRSISKCFPGSNPDHLREKYMQLTKNTPEHCTPNIDEPMKEALKRDEALKSYRKLFCRKCLIYNCQFHCHEIDDIVPKLNGNNIKWLEPSDRPCTNTCYLLRNETDENPTQIKAKSRKKRYVNDEAIQINATNSENEWNAAETTMLVTLITVFPDNFCVIAEAIRTKTCQEVHEKYQLLGLKSTHGKKIAAITRRYRPQELEKVNTPCNHAEPCNKYEYCLCINCNKFCNCNPDCIYRTQMTCNCKSTCKRHTCLCVQLMRECDPDHCNCVSCENVNIQQSRGKKLQVATSEIHGWGVFVDEICQKGDFITEYKGEIISIEEADRRGKVYAKTNSTYMFSLNEEYVLDATNYGNKIRFINFSHQPNCISKVLVVNGDHRIGIYATRFIEAGEELTLNYLTDDPTRL